MKPTDIKHRRRLPRAVLTSDALKAERERSQYLEAILNNAADGIITIDDSGLILSINPAGATMFGYHPRELISKNIGMLMSGDDSIERHNHYMDRYDTTGESSIIGNPAREVEGKRKNGDIIHMELTVNPLVIEGETIYIGILRDVTPLKESAKEIAEAYELLQTQMRDLEEVQNTLRRNREEREVLEQHFTAITQSSSNAIVSINEMGVITSWNPAAEKIFGWTLTEALGKPLTIIMPERFHKDHVSSIQRVATDSVNKPTLNRTVELVGIRKNGEEFPIELSISSWWVGQQVFFGGIMRDITEKKNASNIRTQYIAELEEKEEAATVANRAKSEFLANMSHELRTPLNAVIGFSEVMLSETFGPLDERYKEYCGDILASGQHLLTVINDILDLSKIESGKIELFKSDVSIGEAANASYRLISERAMDKNISVVLDIEKDVIFHADEAKIKQILLNLMTNAIKFTEEGGKVSVTVGEYNDTICFTVADTGIGMDEAGVEQALAKFGQVENNITKTQEGTGLGLPLTVELVKLHGGTLNIDSELGKGTTITVCIPMEKA